MSQNNKKSMYLRGMIALAVFIVVGFGIMVGMLVRYQIFQHERYRTLALKQQTLDTEISAKSGTIYDCNYVELAVSNAVQTVSVCPTEIETDGDREAIAKELSQVLGLEYNDVFAKVSKKSMYERIKRKVEPELTDKLRQFISDTKVKGIHFEEETKRYYPYSTLASRIIGFRGADNQGLYGVELGYDNYLTGTNGKLVTAKNAAGGELPIQYETFVEAEDGQDIVLTIDTTVQQYLTKHLEVALEEHNASAACGIVMRVKTGEILGMAVEPDFDLNNPYAIPDEVIQKEFAGLTGEELSTKKSEYLNSRWRNSLISDGYEPGSTFKIITASMALEEGKVTPETTGFYCDGGATVADRRIGCWKHEGHGGQNFQEAIQNSCNPAFIRLGQMIGAKTFLKYVNAFGLQSKTGIDLKGEATGLFHSPDQFNEVELAVSSFGQTFKVTPIEMITAVCAVANGGNLMRPHVVKQITQTDADGNIKVVKNIAPTTVRQVISTDTSKTMCDMLEKVVSVGSGKNAYVKGYRIAGKTGTSEKTDQRNESGEVDKYIASFIGFAPANDPEIAILIMIDEPKAGEYFGGLVAAPIAGDVMSDILPYLGVQPEYTPEELATVDVAVPAEIGKDSDAAIKDLESAGFNYKLVGGEGKIETQNPASGEHIPQKGTVVLYTNGEKPTAKCTVPDLSNLSFGTAKRELAEVGLNIRVVGNAKSGSVVSSQEPEAGSVVAGGSVVTVKLKSYNDVAD